MLARSACDICQSTNQGSCITTNNQTCICFGGYIGPSCQDRVTTASTLQVTITVALASVFGSALVTLIVGLVIFFLWKRRVKKKSFTFSTTTSTTETIPGSETIVAPALYNLSLSHRDSSVPTETYHIYDELP